MEKKNIKYVDVSEAELEDLIRIYPTQIEDGLKYIDHQRNTNRGPLDVLMVDSGNALIVSELKIIEDDTMLVQCIDYYDYISNNIEAISNVYKKFKIDLKQQIRLMLIAPSFSVNLLNRFKWIDIPISLYTYRCIKIDDNKDIIPVFNEVSIPRIPETIESYSLKDRLDYITDDNFRNLLNDYLNDLKAIDKSRILVEPTKYDISLKFSGRVFAYACPRRNFFVIYTYNNENKWTPYTINQRSDLEEVRIIVNANIEKFKGNGS